MGLLKKLGRKKGKNQSADQTADGDDINGKNDHPQETEVVEPQAEPAPKEVKKTADELVAEMFSKQKQDDMKNHAAVSTWSPKQSADERVAQMFAKSKPSNDSKPTIVAQKLDAEELVAGMRSKSLSDRTNIEEKKVPAVGKTIEQKKAIEALLQKQHDPKGFIDSKKGTKGEIAVASNSVNSFAERKKMAEALSQNKVVTDELKHTVDVSAEDFGDKNSFAQRRKMLEAKSQGQNMPSPTNGA